MKDAVLLRKDPDDEKKVIVDRLLEAEGHITFEAKAQALGYPSTGMIHTAFTKGGAVSSALIAAIRLHYPEIPYERLFVEGRVLAARKVTVDAPANAAA